MKWEQWNRDIFEELVALWNKELGEYFPMRKELFEQNSFDDSNVDFDGSLIALDDEGRIVGFIVVKQWQDPVEVDINKNIGWIQVILVDHTYRGRGIGTALLKHAEKTLKNKTNRIFLGRDTWHYFPGIPKQYMDVCKWFEHKGYQARWEEVDLYRKFDKSINVNIPARNGVDVELANEANKMDLLAFLLRCFPGRWEYEALKYFEKGGTGREYLLLKKDSEIIGFCRINDGQSPFIAQNVYWSPLFDEELGGIGPLGVDPAERKNGYGLLIVEAGIAHLRQRGIRTIVIDWTGLVDFYQKLGFGVWKRYLSYEKVLD